MQHDEIELVANRCRLELQAMGTDLKVIESLPEMVRHFGMLDNKVPGPAADQSKLLLTQTNCFSVFCFEEGEPIAGFAVRIDDLGNEDAQSFLPRSIETIFGVKVTSTLAKPYIGSRWGKAAYFGDLKSINRRGLTRKRAKVLQLAAAYAQYRSFTYYGANTNYSFLRHQDARNAFVYGFHETGPYVWRTDRDLFPDGSPGCIAWLSRERLPLLIAGASMLLPEHVGIEQKPRLEVITKDAAGST